MKLFYSPASPFVCKVRMAAQYTGAAIDSIAVDAVAEPEDLLASNPLGKIPCLVLDNGRGIYDSKVIMRELDRLSGGKLFPGDHDALLDTEQMESLADGLADCAVAAQYELRMRPEEKVHQPWFDRQWGKVLRGLDVANANPPAFGGELNAGHFALAALLGYLDLRYPEKWQDGRSALVAWQTEFRGRFPDYENLKPAA